MNKKKYYKMIFSYFKKEKVNIIIYFITSLIIVALSTISPALSAKLLTSITNVDLKMMFIIGTMILIISTLDEIIHYFNGESSRKIQDRVEIKIKEDVSKELFNLEMKNFDKEGTGFFATRIEREPTSLAAVFTRLRYGFTGFLTSIGIFIFIFYTSPIYGIFFILLSLVNFLINITRTKRWENERKQSNEMYEKYSSNFGELIRGIKDIKVLNLKNQLIKKTTNEQKELTKFEYEMYKKDNKVYIIIDFIRSLGNFFFIVLGIFLVHNHLLPGASLLIIYMYKDRAIYILDEVSTIYRDYKSFNLSLERLYELVDDSKYPKEKYGTKNIENIKGTIEFKDVSFGYENTKVLNKVNFKINSCETIGIVGKSGVGKTTIINLINKLYNVDKGQILIDGIDINELSESSIRNNISTITQNPYIFNTSIKNNLRIANPKITDKEIKEKCKLCALDEYINSLPKKYNTLVGENGVILSGGLKQRVSIARAIIKKSKILILDEATSSLDNETQDYIHHSIKKIKKDYTIIIIAHRLSTVIDCDKILVVDKGKIVGFDTHDNLIKNNKVYQKLYKKELI